MSVWGDNDSATNGYTIFYDKYFNVVREELKKGRKKAVYRIISKNYYEIGVIKWYGAWRKYCFFPNGDTVWDTNCLISINYLLMKLNQD